jgi:hypothetical protein
MAKVQTLEEIREARHKLEHELAESIAMTLAQFKEHVGLDAQGIDVQFEARTTIGKMGYSYRLSRVRVDLGSI